MLQINPTLCIPDAELEWSYAHSGGPGGQNVNKVATKAVLRWNVAASLSVPGEIKERFCTQNRSRITVDGVFMASSERTRSQLINKQDCLALLAALLTAATKRPRLRKKTRPTRASKERRLEAKKKRSATKLQRRGPGDD